MLKLRLENLIAVVDNRERAPFDLSPLQMERGSLQTGDYTLQGLRDAVCLERKSLADLVTCCGPERERFMRELVRMRGYPCRAVIVESGWEDLAAGNYRSNLNPLSATHSVISWMARYSVPFLFAGSREAAQEAARYFLISSGKRAWERLQTFHHMIEAGRQEGAA